MILYTDGSKNEGIVGAGVLRETMDYSYLLRSHNYNDCYSNYKTIILEKFPEINIIICIDSLRAIMALQSSSKNNSHYLKSLVLVYYNANTIIKNTNIYIKIRNIVFVQVNCETKMVFVSKISFNLTL